MVCSLHFCVLVEWVERMCEWCVSGWAERRGCVR